MTSYADCIYHLLSETRRGKRCSLTNGAKANNAVKLDSSAAAAVEDALQAIFSRPVINHFAPLRGATDRAADGQMSHDKSSTRRWHQSHAKPSFPTPARPNLTTPSLPSPMFSLLFNYPWLPLFLSVSFRKKRKSAVERTKKREAKLEKLIADCHAVFKSLLRPR